MDWSGEVRGPSDTEGHGWPGPGISSPDGLLFFLLFHPRTGRMKTCQLPWGLVVWSPPDSSSASGQYGPPLDPWGVEDQTQPRGCE